MPVSFGYGIGDILAVSKLALKVYNAYKNAPADFRNISHEIESLHIILAREHDRLMNMTFQTKEQEELRRILQGCRSVLRDLHNLLIKHKRLGTGERGISEFAVRVKIGFEDISELRARLVSNTLLLNTFITGCAMDAIKDLITNSAHAPRLRRAGSISSARASFAPSLNIEALPGQSNPQHQHIREHRSRATAQAEGLPSRIRKGPGDARPLGRAAAVRHYLRELREGFREMLEITKSNLESLAGI